MLWCEHLNFELCFEPGSRLESAAGAGSVSQHSACMYFHIYMEASQAVYTMHNRKILGCLS